MELNEFHVLHWQTGTQHHGAAVACARMRRRTGEVGSSIPASGENDLVRTEAMNAPGRQFDRNNAAADSVLHDQVDCEVLNEELGIMFE